MLKHVDPSRRSRRTVAITAAAPASSSEDALSLRSSSAASEDNSNANGNGVLFRDAATSPRASFRRGGANSNNNPRKRTILINSSNAHNEAPVPIKVYARCLRSDIEYKTLSLSPQTTSKDLIWTLLSKYRMRHRDPRLFYLTMDINIKRTGIPLKRSIALDDDARPAELKSCHPWGECKFTLQMRKGAVVRVHDSVLMAESKYKCLLISEDTTAEEVIGLLFHCYGLHRDEADEDGYHLVEELASAAEDDQTQQQPHRRMSMDERPVLVQSGWPSPSHAKFVLRKSDDVCLEDDDDELELDVDMSTCSDFSALRFRDSPVSSSARSSESSDSGVAKSAGPVGASSAGIKKKKGANVSVITTAELAHAAARFSLQSLLEALPAASVDTGRILTAADGGTSSAVIPRRRTAGRPASLSSLSLDSSKSSSDYDSYFYI